MGINEVDMISDNWLCFILMGHLFVHFLCEFDLIKDQKLKTLGCVEGKCWTVLIFYIDYLMGLRQNISFVYYLRQGSWDICR